MEQSDVVGQTVAFLLDRVEDRMMDATVTIRHRYSECDYEVGITIALSYVPDDDEPKAPTKRTVADD